VETERRVMRSKADRLTRERLIDTWCRHRTRA